MDPSSLKQFIKFSNISLIALEVGIIFYFLHLLSFGVFLRGLQN